MSDPYLKFAFALDGLIRSRVKGHGGEPFARKCIREMAEALREVAGTVTLDLEAELDQARTAFHDRARAGS
jgi:hypothetical protein